VSIVPYVAGRYYPKAEYANGFLQRASAKQWVTRIEFLAETAGHSPYLWYGDALVCARFMCIDIMLYVVRFFVKKNFILLT
jgi:hypothetical protein